MTNINWIEDDEDTSEKERRYEKEGKALLIYPTDPHGFWRIKFEKKTKEALPRILDGCFTGVGEAEKAINSYFASLALEAKPKKENLIGA